jgi:exosortase A-associated hydrolase 1
MKAALPGALEEAFCFDVEGETLVGILHGPARAATGDSGAPSPAGHETNAAHATGVVVVVGGPQYRAGSHRQFVHLARHLAAAGHPVLRFDVRGMGDSSGAQRCFEDLGPDIGAAIDQLQRRQPQVRCVVLWGLCDGASAALLYLHQHADPRVQGLCLLNPWVRSEASLARTQVKHYYGQRLMQREFWLKLLSGKVAGAAVRGLWQAIRAARGPTGEDSENSFQVRMAQAWRRFPGPLLLVLSGRDYTAREFIELAGTHLAWRGALERAGVERHDAIAADHTFSQLAERQALERTTQDWLRRRFAPTTG